MGNRDEQKVFNIHAERTTTDPSHLLSNIFHFWLDDRLDDDDKRKIMMCLKVIHQFDTLMCKSAFCCNLLLKTLSNHTQWVLVRSRNLEIQNSEFFSIDEQVLSSNMQEKAPPQVCKLFPFLIKFLGSRVREYARPNYLLRPCMSVCLLM